MNIGELLEKSAEYQTEMRKIRDEANRARAEAAEKRPRTESGTFLKPVSPQTEARLASKTTSRNYSTEQQNKSTAAKAVMLEVSRPAVERAEFIKRNAPALLVGGPLRCRRARSRVPVGLQLGGGRQ